MPIRRTMMLVVLSALISVSACQRKDNQDNRSGMGSREEAPPATVAPSSTAEQDRAVQDGPKVAMEEQMPAPGGAPGGDAAITANVSAAIASDPKLANQPIKVTTHEGVVSLTGTVDAAEAVHHAAAIAAEVKGVVNVDNRLTVMVSR